MLKKRPGIALRYKRDPEGARNWVEGFYIAICEKMNREVALVALLDMLGDKYPTAGLPSVVIENMRDVIHERNQETEE